MAEGPRAPDQDEVFDLEFLYQEIILDHYRAPKNYGGMQDATACGTDNNPLCGDEIGVAVKLADGKIEDVKFTGKGCSISQASASMMTEKVKGAKIEDARQWIGAVQDMMRGRCALGDDELEDLSALRGVAKFPVRIKCALLGWAVLNKILSGGRNDDGRKEG